ncbi:MAG: putative repeat protein (TIGR01451 family) [Dokdonia sp.]|jgi:uncharacterized repeat protein (TIGR01451 family)
MKKITLLLFIFIQGAIQAQIIDFPDENLKNALLTNTIVIDTNNDGEIQVSEAVNYSNNRLVLQNEEITSILGVEYFINVDEFFFTNNDIGEADVSLLHWAKTIGLWNNDLSEIDLSSNLVLESFNIGGSNLTELDISNNLQLTNLTIAGNPISSIDTSANDLLYLNISGTGFTTLDDFANENNLESLRIAGTQITDPPLSIFPNLQRLDIRNMSLGQIDLSQVPLLVEIFAGDSGLSSLDVSNNLLLHRLFLSGGNITEIDLSNNINLHMLNLGNSALEYLDISNNPNICHIFIYGDNLTYINARNGNNTNINPNNTCTLLPTSSSGFSGDLNIGTSPNLQVVCVDNIEYALENFNIPDGVSLLESCPGNLANTNQLIGAIAYDETSDGCDPDDQPVSTLIHSTNGVSSFATTSTLMGDFNLHVLEGAYDTQLLGLPDYFTTDPIIHQNTFTGYDQTENIDFCISSTATVNDLTVTLIPTSQARPGFESSYQIIYSNIGTTTLSGTVDFDFNDTLSDFEGSNPVPTNTSGNTISWDFENLSPFTSRTIDIVMLVEQPPIVEGNDILQYTAVISPNTNDITPENNTFRFDQIVVNSFDPNDKTCLEGEEVLFENADKYLHYLVRFQNTGTASAINVRVADQLDEKLDWTTLVVESLSHPGRTEIQNGRDLSFIFDDINLPHEAADPEGSNGFIAFKIKPKNTVVLGDTVENTAFIFFDFNPPIITNTTQTTFVETLAVDDVPTITVEMYPNPTSDILYINSDQLLKKVTIYNNLGQSVRIKDLEGTNSQIDMSDLNIGVYFVSLQTISGVSEYKQIIKK